MTRKKSTAPKGSPKVSAKGSPKGASTPANKKSAKSGAKSSGVASHRLTSDLVTSDQYVVLARKYRPDRFEDLIGQEAMVKTLQNAFRSERIAQAYMLTGVRGIGKTTTARILARALNFEEEGKPGGPTTGLEREGIHCREIIESRHPDVLELDAASNTSVDNIREIIEAVRYRPVSARYKVYIIDEVHMLSRGAFNALLKTLEEPPEHVKFIFATTEIRKVPVTVLSRCQRFDLRRVEIPVLVDHVKSIAKSENASVSDDALRMIARSAEGSVRDGLSLLDQAIAMGSGTVKAETVRAMLGLADRGRIYDLLENVLSGKVKDSLEAVSGLYMDGAEPSEILSDLANAVHAATRIKTAGLDAAPDSLTTDDRARMGAMAEKLSVPALARAWAMILKGLGEVSDAPDPRVAVEMLLIRMAHMADLPSPEDLIRRYNADADRRAKPDQQTRGNTNADHAEAPARADSDHAETLPEADPITLAGFDDLVVLIDRKRDVKLLSDVENHIRLVGFEDGRIEVNLTETAPQNLVGRLGQQLKSWTGKRWVVIVSGDEGEPTIAERRQARFQKDLNEIRDHPAIKAVEEHFPGAEIKDIRKLDPGNDPYKDEDNADDDTKQDNRRQR